jgi:hypothetical protein
VVKLPPAPSSKLKTPEAREIAELLDVLKLKAPAVEECEALTEALFDKLTEYLGQYEARRIFNKYAPAITKREAQLEKSAGLLFRYIYMRPKRGDVAKLVRQLAREDGSDKDAITQSIWRAVNTKTAYGKKVRAYLREEMFERGITVRTQDNSGQWIDVWAGDLLNSIGKSPDDALSELEASLRDIFE